MGDCLTSTTIARRSEHREFLRDVLLGLAGEHKSIPCKYFYDRRGSKLFDAICELPEYYVTRTELEIMREHAAEMAAALDRGVMLIEFGSGSSIKTQLLLRQLMLPAAYVPVDISGRHLEHTAARLRGEFAEIEILPVCADFTRDFLLPHPRQAVTHRAIYFPGSTVGNFEPAQAEKLLCHMANICGQGGGLLIGIDLQKDPAILEAAYNDEQGVTAEFNLNLLRRANCELEADFKLRNFKHKAWYDRHHHRMDIGLISRRRQVVHIDGVAFKLAEGEVIRTEYSHKYTVPGFAEMAAQQGFQLRKVWQDRREYFAVLHLVVDDRNAGEP